MVHRWRDEGRRKREQEEIRRKGRRWTNDALEIDTDNVEAEADESSESEDDEEDNQDSEEVKALKVDEFF
ncbi:hypothetical protein JVT61DRAFT_12208 [Boletus reticuloceps]|uniref:Uncharacterized protein n=1 Tax=Boletus reticuloceps TaxID=495285 RepID=A0A8I3A4G9_9AGAM|nr:hypothetical protein JVT61DRAFT_12208 [Boletus reticuloceps]